jgi:hypothetical protein
VIRLRTQHLGGYMRRWTLETPWFSFRVHHILRSDHARSFHDHPFDYWSLLLTNGYTEHTPLGYRYYPRFSLLKRYAESQHRLELTDGPVWTLVWTGPNRKPWGFIQNDTWLPWYLAPSEWSVM